MTELFDEVDEDDKPTGRLVNKQQAHDGMLIHRCSVIYVFNEDGRLYLQLHKKSGNRLDHSAGGHVSSGETYKHAAKRELEEELGISAPLTMIKTHFLSREKSHVHMYGIYTCVAPSNWVFKPNLEVSQLKLVLLSDLVNNLGSHPEAYTSGIINTLNELLPYTNSTLKVKAKLLE